MKICWMLGAAGILALVLSQPHCQAQTGAKGTLDPNAKVIQANTKGPKPSDFTPSLQTLAATVSDLQDTVAGLKKEVTALKTALSKTNASLDSVKAGLSVPAGYTATWMSRANLDRVKGNELMRFHVQIVTPNSTGSK